MQLHASRPWAGAYRAAHAVAQCRSPLVAIEKVPAHTVEVLGESPATRLRRLANEWADEKAKEAAALNPLPSNMVEDIIETIWRQARIACRVLAEATILWPAAVPSVPRSMRPTTRGARQQQAQRAQERRAATTSARRSQQQQERQTIDASHRWVQCGVVERCAHCHCVRRTDARTMVHCPGIPEVLSLWAAQARDCDHSLAVAALCQRGTPGDTVALIVCIRCGAWSTAASQRKKSLLLRPCRRAPSRAGAEVLARVRRGLHPKPGYEPPLITLWRPAEAVQEAMATRPLAGGSATA